MCQRLNKDDRRIDLQLRDFEMSDSETELLLDTSASTSLLRGRSGGSRRVSRTLENNSDRRSVNILNVNNRNRRKQPRKLGNILRSVCG